MAISTRLTQRFNLTHPVISAPMDVIAGGKLAAAVSGAGGLGMLGGGYSDDDSWFERGVRGMPATRRSGCGFITWALRQHPKVLDAVIARKPKAIFLSFDDPEPFTSRIKGAGIPVICQLQTRADAERAFDCGVDVIVAQAPKAAGTAARGRR
jgi:nitronate monooxygenase